MTEAFRAEESLAVSADTAWAALTDLAHAPAWMPGVDSMHIDGELRAGALITFRARGGDRTSTVTTLEPGRSMTLTSTQGGVRADYRYGVEQLPGATSRVTLAADVVTSGGMKLLGPVIRSSIAKADGSQLTRFKAFVERG